MLASHPRYSVQLAARHFIVVAEAPVGCVQEATHTLEVSRLQRINRIECALVLGDDVGGTFELHITQVAPGTYEHLEARVPQSFNRGVVSLQGRDGSLATLAPRRIGASRQGAACRRIHYDE
jgi:hypothetical protein